jgi:hypothetical protein
MLQLTPLHHSRAHDHDHPPPPITMLAGITTTTPLTLATGNHSVLKQPLHTTITNDLCFLPIQIVQLQYDNMIVDPDTSKRGDGSGDRFAVQVNGRTM